MTLRTVVRSMSVGLDVLWSCAILCSKVPVVIAAADVIADRKKL
jgi:hypothetical protein